MIVMSRLLSSCYRVHTSIKILRIQSINYRPFRLYSSESVEKGLSKKNESADVSTEVRPLGEKIKETTKTISYTGVILVGLGVTGIIFYYVFRELFSSNSANNLYAQALDKCINDPQIEEILGAPIKGYGEETTRRRRTHVSHALYEKDGVQHMRMRFYVKGVRNKGIVETDLKKNEFGKFVTRYLLVQIDDYSGRVFVIEDNRAQLDQKSSGGLPAIDLSSLAS